MNKKQIYVGCVVKLKNNPDYYVVTEITQSRDIKIKRICNYTDINDLIRSTTYTSILSIEDCIHLKDIDKYYTFSDYARLIQDENK